MADEVSFRDLIGRVRHGDEQAAAELVRRYEPAIRRAVRFRLTDPRLRRTCDSMDVCQSVLLSFFVRAASGQYDLDIARAAAAPADDDGPQQAAQPGPPAPRRPPRQPPRHRRHRRPRRRRPPPPAPASRPRPASCSQEVHRRLDPDELRLVELRNQGHDWAAIAALVGGNAAGPAAEAPPRPRPAQPAVRAGGGRR